MSNVFDQFDDQQPQQTGNVFDQFDQFAQPATEEERRSLFERGVAAFTGADRMTPEIEGLQEIGNAPELNELSLGAFRASLGLLATGDEEKGVQILRQQIPDVTARKDDKGNVIVKMPSGEYVLNKPGFSGQDLARFVAQWLAFTPAGRATSIPGAAIGAGATEAGLQAIAAGAGAEGIDTGDIGTAALLGAGGKAAEELISGVTRATRGAMPVEAEEVIARGRAEGAPVLTTDVVPPDTLAGRLARVSGETVPFAGTGATRAAQQQARIAAVERETGGLVPMYDQVVDSLKKKTTGMRQAAGKRLEEVADTMEQFGDIPTPKAIQAIDDEIATLSDPRRVKDPQTIKALEEYKEALEQGQTFKTLDTLRSDFRESVKGERQSLPTRSNAAMERVYQAFTDDMTDAITEGIDARTAARFMDAKRFYGQELDTLKKTRLKTVLDKGDVAPETVRNVLISQKPSEMQALFRSLNTDGRKAARVTILNDIVEKASRRVGGLTPNSFATELDKASNAVNIFFKGKEREQLQGLQRFLDATRRAQEAPVQTPTGQTLLSGLGLGGVVVDPVSTLGAGLTVGTLARIYESPAVRNAMLRLSTISPRSDRYDVVVREVAEALQAAAQAARPED